ncbi:MAG: hypothetical protein ACP5P3_02830 [Ignavibacteria bacterium]
MKIRILTICYLTSICKLIKKSFPTDMFEFVCVEYKDNCEDLEKEISEKIALLPDAVIIDRGLGKEFAEVVSKKFVGSKIMYLPSLEDSSNGISSNSQDVIKLSEPFSLREIRKVLLNLYEKKFGQIQ